MTNTVRLLLTAVVSLTIGAGGAYSVLRVNATCSVVSAPAAAANDSFRNFMAEPPDRVGGGPRY